MRGEEGTEVWEEGGEGMQGPERRRTAGRVEGEGTGIRGGQQVMEGNRD